MIIQKLIDILFPKTKQYAQSTMQESMSEQPYAKYAYGQPEANLPKFILEKARQEFGSEPRKVAAEIGAWTVPFGKGTTLVSKVLAPGAMVGGLNALSQDKTNPADMALNMVAGAGGAYGLNKTGALASKWVGKLTQEIPETIMSKLLRPTQVKTTKAEIKNVIKGGESLGKWALRQPEFKAPSVEKMLTNVTNKIETLEDEIQTAVQGSFETVAKNDVVKKIMPYYNNLIKAGNKEAADTIMGRIDDIFKQGEFLDLPTANGVKRMIYKEVRNSYDKLGSETAEGLKKIGNALMGGIEKGAKQVKSINKEYGNFLKAEESLLNQASRGTRNFSLGGIDAIVGGIGTLIGGLPGAATAIGLRKVAQNPGVQTATARALSKGQNLANVGLSPYLSGQLGSRVGTGIANLLFTNQVNKTPDETNSSTNQNIDNHNGSFQGDYITIKDGQLSPQGQWVFSAKNNDWIPNPQYQAQGITKGTDDEERRKQIAMLSVTMKPADFKQLQDAYKIMTGEDLIPTEDKDQGFRDNLKQSIDTMENLYFADGKSLSMGDSTVGLEGLIAKGSRAIQKQTDQEYVNRLQQYNMIRAQAIGILNQARGAGTLNSGEYEVMIKNMPNEYTPESVAREYFDTVRKLFEKATPSTRTSSS